MRADSSCADAGTAGLRRHIQRRYWNTEYRPHATECTTNPYPSLQLGCTYYYFTVRDWGDSHVLPCSGAGCHRDSLHLAKCQIEAGDKPRTCLASGAFRSLQTGCVTHCPATTTCTTLRGFKQAHPALRPLWHDDRNHAIHQNLNS